MFLDDENLAILPVLEQSLINHRPMQVPNISNLIHPATLNWAAKTSVGVLLKTWMAAPTTWFVVFPHRESITPLNLLAMLCPVQPRKLLAAFAARTHCQAMVNLLSPRDPRSFFWPAAFQPVSLQSVPVYEVILLQVPTLAFPSVWNFPPTCFTCSKLYN